MTTTRPDPATHRCDVRDIDYTQADDGRLRCVLARGGCGRRWTLIPGRGWVCDPRPVAAPRRRDDR